MSATLSEEAALILEQFVQVHGMQATLRGLADVALQRSQTQDDKEFLWHQISTALHTCASSSVEPLLKRLPESKSSTTEPTSPRGER